VRLAALQGLRALVLSGLPAGMLERTVAPAVQPLAFDHTASVREAYYAAVAAWLGCGGGRGGSSGGGGDGAAATAAAAHACCRTYAHVLLPLLLLGVSDEQPGIATAALQAVEQAGAAWQLQPDAGSNSSSSSSGPAASAPADLAPAADAATPMDTDATTLSTSSASHPQPVAGEPPQQVPAAAVAAAQLPPPYHGLPSAAAREMAAALLPQLLPQVLSGLREWTATLRCAAAR
jgi:hypothetical protein